MRFILFIALFIASMAAHGQANKVASESLADISDSVLKREIASFTIKGRSLEHIDTMVRSTLKELPLRHCTDKEVYLSRSTFTGSVGTFIHLYFKEENAHRKLDSIFLVVKNHVWVRFPDNAFRDIYQANSCNLSSKKKRADFFSLYYKALYSADKNRLYIYMLCEMDSHEYEVTWVIENGKYFTRVLDSIP